MQMNVLTPMGRPKTIDDAYVQRLGELVQQSPRAAGYAFDRWTAHWLRAQLLQELGIAVTDRHINRLLQQMGLSSRDRIRLHSHKRTDKCAHKDDSACSIVITDLF